MQAPIDPEVARSALGAVVGSGGADAYDVFLAARAGEYTRFAGNRIHQPQDITEVQVMVRAIVDGHAARVATSGLAGLPAAARDAARMAAGIARAAGRPGHTRVAPATGDPCSGDPDESLIEESTEAFDAGARVALVRAAMNAGEAAGMFGRALTQLVVATSTGVLRSTLATEASGALTI
jgi:PmbA protein